MCFGFKQNHYQGHLLIAYFHFPHFASDVISCRSSGDGLQEPHGGYPLFPGLAACRPLHCFQPVTEELSGRQVFQQGERNNLDIFQFIFLVILQTVE